MKCLKNSNTAEIKRVSDERATEMVATGNWAFIPKKEWKAIRPTAVVAAKVEEEVLPNARPKKIPGKKHAYREEVKRKRYAQK